MKHEVVSISTTCKNIITQYNRISRAFDFEFTLWVKMSYRDWNIILIAPMLFALEPFTSSLESTTVPFSSLVWALVKLMVHLILSMYVFHSKDQVHGINEDQIDKPDRPVPSGLISVEALEKRQWSVTGIFLIFGACIGGWTLLFLDFLWYITVKINKKGSKHWATKCLLVSIAISCIFGYVIVIFGNISHNYDIFRSIRWVVVFSICTYFSFNIQDFRDAAGDSKTGRLTLVNTFSQNVSRLLVIISVLAMIPIVYFKLAVSLRKEGNVDLAYSASRNLCNFISTCMICWI